MSPLQLPPGRMGRLWLLGRLELAERGVTVLEEKLRLLDEQRQLLQDRADQSKREWHDACCRADMWGLRATLLGGQRAITLATPRTVVSITVQWVTTAGVHYPDRVECTWPSDDGVVVHTNSATVQASLAYRAAVAGAAQHAADQFALTTIDNEFRATWLRGRALSAHWLPRLRDELARINLTLEEQDRAEAIRLRLVRLGHG
jgi:V/A-type H+/Na+-transporting ATPase subunit D